jgi:hypothetical protein
MARPAFLPSLSCRAHSRSPADLVKRQFSNKKASTADALILESNLFSRDAAGVRVPQVKRELITPCGVF